MSVYFGNDTVNDLYIGLTPVSKGYVGTHLFYDGNNTIIDTTYEKYILNTQFNILYNTAEKPVKSAILKGWSLVNLLKANKNDYIINLNPKNWSVEDGYLKCVSTTGWHTITDKFSSSIKPNTKYLIVVEIKENTLSMDINFDGYGTTVGSTINFLTFEPNEVGTKKAIITTISTLDDIKGGFFRMPLNITNNNSILKLRVMAIEYQEGMENWDIPYFEGMQSVQMPVLTTIGKNIFHESLLNKVYKKTIDGEEYFVCEGSTTANGSFIIDGNKINNKNQITFSFDVVNPNSATWANVYVEYSDHQTATRLPILSSNRVAITSLAGKTISRIAFTTESRKEVYIKNIQLEYNSTSTTYEPYKSNILTVNEDVTLRSNGDVYDELNLLTGRLTQRIDENNEVLAQEVVKTVDLSVVNQDGNNTKLSTFDDLTHVTLSSEGFIPVAELEVATKNEEVLSTLSLEMDDISETQTTLEKTSNTQSENVDATMIATTEIYEQIL